MSRVEYAEGVRYATTVLEEACHIPDAFTAKGSVPTVLENLQSAMNNKPKDFADGVRSVLVKVAAFLKAKKGEA